MVNSFLSAEPKRLAWLDILRAFAVLLVLWDHLVGQFLSSHKIHWFPNDIVEKYFISPLVICQHGGFLGVCIFFLISGYIIARVLNRESELQFITRRILRIFPLLFVVSSSVWVLAFLGVPGMPLVASKTSFLEVIKNTLLINYLSSSQIILVGTAWTLVIEVSFYIVALIVLPFQRKKVLPPVALPIIILLVTYVSMISERRFGANFFLLSVSLAYLPILAIGSLFYLYERRDIPLVAVVTGMILSWVLFINGISKIYPHFVIISIDSYPVSLAAAVVIFGLFYSIRNKLTSMPRILALIALGSYSVYLWHGVVALPLESYLFPLMSFTPALFLSLTALSIVSYFSYNIIEKPCIKVGKNAL